MGLDSLFMAWLWQKQQREVWKQPYCRVVKVIMPPRELLEGGHQFSYLVFLSQQSCSEQSSSLDKVLILKAVPSISNILIQLANIL